MTRSKKPFGRATGFPMSSSGHPCVSFRRCIFPLSTFHFPLCAILIALLSCSRAPEPAPPPPPITQEKSSDSVRVTLTLDRGSITTAQVANLSIRASVAPGFRIREPQIPRSLPEGLTVREDRAEPPAVGADGWSVSQRRVTIEPFLPGEAEFPSLTFEAEPAAKPSGVSAGALSLATDPIRINVTSVLAPGQESEGLAPIKDVAEPSPAPGRTWWLFGGVAAFALAAALIGWLMLRRQSVAERPPPLIPAHELALRRLDALLAQGLIERGSIKPFYERASHILRQYIEDRFGLHAPERTTEEFLNESRASALLTEGDVALLERFLEHCDLVKFAKLPATPEQAGLAVATVRDFIERTRAADRLVVAEDGVLISATPDSDRSGGASP